MPTRTAREASILAGLTPHTRAHALQLLGERPLLQVSSGRRTALRNKQVGGSPTSWHLQGRAVDFTGDRWDLTRAAGLAWALRVGHHCTGPEEVLLEDLGLPNQHLHVAW
jgi:uncharacterized protein YcbK (DUF882 family)